jgi:tetratricopeptide (TPR) repeat protein
VVWSWATEYGDPSRKPGVPRRDGEVGGNPLHQRVMTLQSTAGNAAVQRLVQQDAERRAGAGQERAQPADSKRPATPEILRYGSRGEAVKRLQEALNQYQGEASLQVDGIMGALTTAALRSFQKSHPPLDVDGTAGIETWAELERVGDQGAPLPGATAKDFYDKGKKLYAAGRYALAYDEFAKAHEMNPDMAYLYNMAQSMWLSGGRNADAIKLYEQFIAAGPGEDAVARANEQIAKLRGPSPTGDKAKDHAAADEISAAARKLFLDAEFGRAYDEFTKAYNLTHDPNLLYNRASSLRAMGGQRSQALALLEQLLTMDVSDDKRAAAREEIKEIKGPGRSGDDEQDKTTQEELARDAKVAYLADDYAVAYDLFSKAYEVAHDPAYLWNRAQSLRFQGGRREEAIKLYQQFLALDLPEHIKRAARVHIAELKGPEKGTPGGRAN